MKRFVIQVENNKALFFKELIENFDFAEIIKTDNIVEPRIYPSADFEIRHKGNTAGTAQKSKYANTEIQNMNEGMSISSEEEHNIKQLRDAMSKISKIRDKNRK